MKVWFATTPPTEFAYRWAKPGIAGMSLVDSIASERRLLVEVRHEKVNTPGYTTTFRTGIDLSI
jgi:hypothetical protein